MSLSLVTYAPSASSLKVRTRIAQEISGLKRTKPNVPFWRLPSHRVPTLWSLYRNLLRAAPSHNLRWRVWAFFRWNKNLTSPEQTRDRLRTAYKLLDAFDNANDGDEKTKSILARYDQMISAKRKKTRAENIYRREAAWLQRLRRRPILTGSYLKATKYYSALPIMKPQPADVSLMIRRRKLARDRRIQRYRMAVNWTYNLLEEKKFEARLLQKTEEAEPVFADNGWVRQMFEERSELAKQFERDKQREMSQPSEELLSALHEARQERIRNKTREKERERRGETTFSSVKRRRKGIPAHIRERLSKEQIHRDAVSRSLSEVGYVALVKSRNGQKLKDDKTWREMERGKAENQAKLKWKSVKSLRVNLQRRAKADALEAHDS